MKGGLEIIVRAEGLDIVYDRTSALEELRGEDLNPGFSLTGFCERNGIGSRTVNIFLTEDLVYMTSVALPSKTGNLAEAIGFQIGMLVPFAGEDFLSSYAVNRKEDFFQVMIAAAEAKNIVPLVEDLIDSGFTVKGVYPESQRYVSAGIKKARWALVLTGRKTKVMVFEGAKLVDRFLPDLKGLSRSGLVEICGTEHLFHTDPPIAGGYNSAGQLLGDNPLLKDFNMLPPSFRRPDYLKMAILVLVGVNLFALALLGGFKYSRQGDAIEKTQAEISELAPVVRKVNATKRKISDIEKFLEQVGKTGKNPDIINFLDRLTKAVPDGSYIDQLKFDAKDNIMTVYGYTDDISGLTDKLQETGEIRLKSTSRRRNMTYFQVEIVL